MSAVLPIVYLARHGETAWTVSGQHTGLTDLPLTKRGERNARRLEERLRGVTFAKVLTSPLQRATRTCELAGSDSLLVHWEGNNNLHRTVQRVKALGKGVGVVINPATPASVLEEILRDVDQVLVMTVNPGFGHQHFIHTTLPKIRRVRQMIDEIIPGCDLEVDGGIDATTAPLVVDAGANVLVAGSAVFGAGEGVVAAMNRLRAAANESK
jgi:ribulose-phosphate 3-epimerase